MGAHAPERWTGED